MVSQIPSLRNINEYEHKEANAVKASKYFVLLERIMQGLEGTPLQNLKREWKELKEEELEPLAKLTKFRDYYISTITKLREKVGECPEAPYLLYTENVMELQSKELIQLLLRGQVISGLPLLDALKITKKLFDTAPEELTTNWLNSAVKSSVDWMDYRFSPLKSGNPPQRFPFVTLFKDQLKVLGNGTPTVQEGPAAIEPVFFGFLKALKAKGQKYLYVSNQNGLNSENTRNSLIMGVQDHPEVAGAMIAITCAKDSPFYRGIEVDSDSGIFKIRLLQQFFYDSYKVSGCFIPMQLDLKAKCAQLIELLGDFLLSKEPKVEEQLAMIDFYYALLASLIAYEEKCDFISFTCKDGIDRGMESFAEFLLLWLTVIGFDFNSQKSLEIFTEVIFTRSYWVRKRSMNQLRFDRLMMVSEVFLEKSKDSAKLKAFIDGLLKIIPLDEVRHAATVH